MLKFAVLLGYFSWLGFSVEGKTPRERLQSKPIEEGRQSLGDPSRILALLFLRFNRAAGFNPSGPALPPTTGSSILAGLRRPRSWPCSRASPVSMSDELLELELQQDVVELSRNKLGSEHPRTLKALSDHADLLCKLNRYEEAEPLQKQVLEISRRRFGAEHPDSMNALDNYADTLLALDRGSEAKQQKFTVLQLKREQFGSEHPETLAALDNVAKMCRQLGSVVEADRFDIMYGDLKIRRLTQEAEAEIPKKELLEFTKQKLGPSHPDTLVILKRYAETLSRLGREAEAAPLHKELSELKQSAFGEEHQDAVQALSSYADSLGRLEREEEAEPLRREVLERTRQKVGPKHWSTHKAMCSYAATLRKLGRASQAEPWQKEVYEHRLDIRGEDHPDTLRALNNYADTLFELDRWQKAEPLKKQVLDITRNKLGAEHPDTLRALDNYASTLLAIGNETEAEPLKKEVLEISRRKNGDSHSETLRALDSYADTLLRLHREEEAKSIKREVHELMSQKHGAEHPETLKAMSNYAVTCSSIGQHSEALQLKRKVMDITRRLKGSEHPDTNRAMNNYAVTLFEIGRETEAEPLMKQVFEITRRNLGLQHRGTLRALDNYAATLKKIGREAEAGLLKDYLMYEATDKKIVIAMFDFDQTLAQEHVFHTLAQYATSATREPAEEMGGEPVAVSPAGQVSRLTKESRKYNADWAFGGQERITALRDMLQSLQDSGVKMVVCTLGFPAAARKLLAAADLLKYFGWADVPSVIGAAGANYEGSFTRYDLEARLEFGSQVSEHPAEILKGSKVALLDELLDQEGARLKMKLPLSAGVLVEDDPSAVSHAQRYTHGEAYERIVKKGRLHTVEVVDRRGMRPDVEMKQLLELVKG